MKTDKKKYIPPKSEILELVTEPVMSTSGDSRFQNKAGINQDEVYSTRSANTFWNTGSYVRE